MKEKLEFALVVLIVVLLASFGVIGILQHGCDDEQYRQTEELCRQWAAADHSGAVPPERLQWLKEHGVWDNFDWYKSCISESEWLKNMGKSK